MSTYDYDQGYEDGYRRAVQDMLDKVEMMSPPLRVPPPPPSSPKPPTSLAHSALIRGLM